MTRSSRRVTSLVVDPRLRPLRQFGGALLKRGHAKSARPVSTKRGMHIVLQGSEGFSLRSSQNLRKVENILQQQARLWGVSLRERLILKSSIHLLLKVRNRQGLLAFLRAVSGMIAMTVTGAAKTRSLKNSFWIMRPWSRVIDLPRRPIVLADETIMRHLILLGMPQILESS